MKFILNGEWHNLPTKPPTADAVLERLIYPEYTCFSNRKSEVQEACEAGNIPDYMRPDGYGEVLSFDGYKSMNGHRYLVYTVRHHPTWTLEIGSIERLLEILRTLQWSMVCEPGWPEGFWSLEPYSH